jgi:hypothetical protein
MPRHKLRLKISKGQLDATMLTLIGTIRREIHRAGVQILSVGFIYVSRLLRSGSLMVHEGNQFALQYRDKLVGQAQTADPAAIAYRRGQGLEAALLDFGRNLFLGAIPQTITGLTIIPSYGLAAFRGWVGGIVSVDSRHRSWFSEIRQALDLILTLLQEESESS